MFNVVFGNPSISTYGITNNTKLTTVIIKIITSNAISTIFVLSKSGDIGIKGTLNIKYNTFLVVMYLKHYLVVHDFLYYYFLLF